MVTNRRSSMAARAVSPGRPASRQLQQPDDLNADTTQFSVNFAPDQLCSVMQLQLVAPSGRIWRSRPVLTAPLAAETVPVTVYSSMQKRPVTVAVPSNLVPQLDFDWSDARGIVVPNAFARPLWGIRGGFYNLASCAWAAEAAALTALRQGWAMRRRFGPESLTLSRLWSRRRTGFRPCASAAANTSLSPSESSRAVLALR